MPEDDRIFDKLSGMDTKLDNLRGDVKLINGTQQAHTAWIAAHNELTTAQVVAMKNLTEASSAQHDYQEWQRGGINAAKPLILVIWALTLASAAALGAYIGHVVK